MALSACSINLGKLNEPLLETGSPALPQKETGVSPTTPPQAQTAFSPETLIEGRAARPEPIVSSSLNTSNLVQRESGSVAMLLPLTGRLATSGTKMKQAAELALKERSPNLTLTFYDTQSTVEGAYSAAQQAQARGSIAIFGPLSGESISAVTRIARPYNIPVISFSNDTSKLGQGAIMGGILPYNSIEHVLAYAVQQGLYNIAVLAPDNSYGQATLQSAYQASQRLALNIIDAKLYTPDKRSSARSEVAKNIAQNKMAYDAILLADGGWRLKDMVSLLHYHEIDPNEVKLLGTSAWEGSNLSSEPSLHGAWFAAPNNDQKKRFEERFEALYEEKANELATLAYEAVQIADTIVQQYGHFSPAILQSTVFPTLYGNTRYLGGQVALRSMAIKEVGQRSIQVIREPADAIPAQAQRSNTGHMRSSL